MQGIVDFHSHILPGIDDGSASVEESIAMLRMEAEQIHPLGSDCHNMRSRQPNLGKAIERIQRHCGNKGLENIAAFQRDVLGA